LRKGDTYDDDDDDDDDDNNNNNNNSYKIDGSTSLLHGRHPCFLYLSRKERDIRCPKRVI